MSRNKMSGAWTCSHTKTAPAFHRENRGGLIQRFDIRREKKGSSFELLLQFLYGSLSGSQTGDRNTERRAGHIVQTHVVAELDGGRVAAVLTADAQAQIRAGLAAVLGSHLNQRAYAILIQVSKRIALIDLIVVVVAQELEIGRASCRERV